MVGSDRVKDALNRINAFCLKIAQHPPRMVGVIDFSLHSGKKRFFILDRDTGEMKSYLVAHGSGSDPDNDGMATWFSNKSETHASSLGIYRCGEIYMGKHGKSMYLTGLEETNSNAKDRQIVVHAADYVSDQFVKSVGRCGRSWGCPAIADLYKHEIINGLAYGGMIIAIA